MTIPTHSPIGCSDYYAIIGSGPAGLSIARSRKAARIPKHQMEKNPGVGGPELACGMRNIDSA